MRIARRPRSLAASPISGGARWSPAYTTRTSIPRSRCTGLLRGADIGRRPIAPVRHTSRDTFRGTSNPGARTRRNAIIASTRRRILTGAGAASTGAMSLFQRPSATYQVPDAVLDGIASDPASPLLHIAQRIGDGAAVLDIGAGSGLLPRIAARLGRKARFDGIEIDPVAAGVARPHYHDF